MSTNQHHSPPNPVELCLGSFEGLLNGPRLLFHAHYRGGEHRLEALYGLFKENDANESATFQDLNISESLRADLDLVISELERDTPSDRRGVASGAVLFPIYDERPTFVEILAPSEKTAGSKKAQHRILGVIIALPRYPSQIFSDTECSHVKEKIRYLVPLLQQACYRDFDEIKQTSEKEFLASLIKLNRIAQGDVVDKQSGLVSKIEPVFELGAEILHKCFRPCSKACVIFSANSIRYVHSSFSDTSGSGSGSGGVSNSASVNPAGLGSNTSRSENETAQTGPSTLVNVKGVGTVTEKSLLDSRNSLIENDHYIQPNSTASDVIPSPTSNDTNPFLGYMVSSTSMRGKSAGALTENGFQESLARQRSISQDSSLDSLANESSDLDDGDDDDEEVLVPEEMPTRPVQSEPPSLDNFTYFSQGRVICSFPQSAQNVDVLGSYGCDKEKFSNLDGNFLRRVMAGYFASIRQTGLASRVHCEIGEEAVDKLDRDEKTQFREAIGASDPDDAILCVACFDRLGQPAFMIVLLAQSSQMIYDPFKRQAIEFIGICLCNAILRIHAEELSQAQSLFTQKVQHELRTPLHGIMGINEAVLNSLEHARLQTGNLRLPLQPSDPLWADLISYSHSISSSADHLTSLIDDLVDFSIPDVKASQPQNSLTSQSPSEQSDKVRLSIALSILSIASERRWQYHHSKRDNKTASIPEFLFWFDPFFKDIDSHIDVDLDALRRIIGKLMANAMEATGEGLVCVEISLRILPDVKNEKVLSASKQTGKDKQKIRRHRKSHILTIAVQDTGHGMSKAFLANHIFQAYQKEDPDSAGIGLSLAICRTIMEQLGGHIIAESEKTVGSKIITSLPVTLIPFSISQSSHRSSNESASTAKPDLSVAFLGCEGHVSFCALRDMLLKKLDMVDSTDELVRGQLDKIDVIFFFPDHIFDDGNALRFSAKSMTNAKRKIPLAISLSIDRWRVKMSEETQSIFKKIQSATERVEELNRPLTYEKVRRLMNLIRRYCAGSSRDFPSSHLSDQGTRGVLTPIEESTTPEATHEALEGVGDKENMFAVEEQIISKVPSKHFKVLVVEDNPINAKILIASLRRSGIDHLEAQDGEEGVEIFRKELPAVVLLDINMPKMNGFDAAKEMRSYPSPFNHYIAAVTALSSESDRVHGLEVGMDAWYTKPMRMAILVEDLLRRKEAHQRENKN